MSGIFIAILNLIGVIVSSIGVVFVKEWIAKKRRKVITNLLASKAECWMQLDKIASNIRESLNAKGVYVAYFHNGGKFCNGINMDKFTVIAEDYDISLSIHISGETAEDQHRTGTGNETGICAEP